MKDYSCDFSRVQETFEADTGYISDQIENNWDEISKYRTIIIKAGCGVGNLNHKYCHRNICCITKPVK